VIVNPKTLDGGVNVIQLETAVGAAMKCFEKVRGINVPRSRFLPVKKTSDLFLIMSNLYTLTNGSLTMSPERMFQTTPLIKLGDESFKKVIFKTFVFRSSHYFFWLLWQRSYENFKILCNFCLHFARQDGQVGKEMKITKLK
jgi:UDP-N-acetylglucosamine pyrophosphorylase